MNTTAGWSSLFPEFVATPTNEIISALVNFVKDPGEAQLRAWKQSIPEIQKAIAKIIEMECF